MSAAAARAAAALSWRTLPSQLRSRGGFTTPAWHGRPLKHDGDMVAAPGEFEIGRDGPGILLVAVDGSEASLHALAYAIGMTRRECSELVIVQVVPTMNVTQAMATSAGVVVPRQAIAETFTLPENITSALDEFLPQRWRAIQRDGETAVEIERAAGELRADAIVVGRSRDSALHVLGSVSSRPGPPRPSAGHRGAVERFRCPGGGVRRPGTRRR